MYNTIEYRPSEQQSDPRPYERAVNALSLAASAVLFCTIAAIAVVS